jgi:2-polyprenyl-6-methoxyphenol hydroxylase-like FAD-dependent oxidoreductase
MAPTTPPGDHAVVLGASVAGLLAARVLSESFARVTVVERDVLPTGAVHRRGVPQARQTHALLPRGAQILGELFPDLTRALVADGAVLADGGERLRYVIGGHPLARCATGRPGVFASRVLLEHHLRQAVRALPAVTVVDGHDVLAPVIGGDRVTGVRVRRRSDGAVVTVPADLVVDATGRGSRTPVWLADAGRTPPAEDRIVLDVGYTSGRFRLRPGALAGDVGVIVGSGPGSPRGGAISAVEGGEHVAGLAGTRPDHPPTDLPGFLAYARTLCVPDLHDALRGAELVEPLESARFPANVRRRYERLTDLPEGLLVVGDALCAFNPVYGQGMTVAAIEATVLRAQLAAGRVPAPTAFFTAVARAIDPAWGLTTGADRQDAQLDGPARLVDAYVRRLQAAAVHDPALAKAFREVTGLLAAPPTLMRPDRVARVLWATRRLGRRPELVRIGT